MTEQLVGCVNFGPKLDIKDAGEFVTQTIEMAMITRDEFDRWSADSAVLEKLKQIAKSESFGAVEVLEKHKEIYQILRSL